MAGEMKAGQWGTRGGAAPVAAAPSSRVAELSWPRAPLTVPRLGTLHQGRQRELAAAPARHHHQPGMGWLQSRTQPHTQPSAHFMCLNIPQTQENYSNHRSATFSRKTWETLSSSVLVVVASVINIHCKHTTQT